MDRTRDAAAIEALAEAWASIDGKLDAFRRERGASVSENFGAPGFTGHYAGYVEEAAEMIRRIEARGYTVVPMAGGAVH